MSVKDLVYHKFNKRFPKKLLEVKYVDLTLTKSFGRGNARHTDSRRSGTWKETHGWKYRLPYNVESVSEKWYIKRYISRKVLGFEFVYKEAVAEVHFEEINNHACFGDTWPQRVWDVWEKHNLVNQPTGDTK